MSTTFHSRVASVPVRAKCYVSRASKDSSRRFLFALAPIFARHVSHATRFRTRHVEHFARTGTLGTQARVFNPRATAYAFNYHISQI